jgi:hypothetical protein
VVAGEGRRLRAWGGRDRHRSRTAGGCRRRRVARVPEVEQSLQGGEGSQHR